MNLSNVNDSTIAGGSLPRVGKVGLGEVLAIGQYVQMRMPSVRGEVVGDFDQVDPTVDPTPPEGGATEPGKRGGQGSDLNAEGFIRGSHGEGDEPGRVGPLEDVEDATGESSGPDHGASRAESMLTPMLVHDEAAGAGLEVNRGGDTAAREGGEDAAPLAGVSQIDGDGR